MNFEEIWLLDFEYTARPGEIVQPICLVAHGLRSPCTIRQFQGEFSTSPPYSIDKNSLIVTYFATAELGCHLALGWLLPVHVLDLYVEFRARTNGRVLVHGNSLFGALTFYGQDGMDAMRKASMRQVAERGGPFSSEERSHLLEYCRSDVEALGDLLCHMANDIDRPRALWRGRFMKAVAIMEHRGIPIDMPAFTALSQNWQLVQDRQIDEVNRDYGVYDEGSFREHRFAEYLARAGIALPRLSSGRLDLREDTFRTMARRHPRLEPLRQLRITLAQMRLSSLEVGHDGRNRTSLSPFRSRTSRCQPSNAKFIFGPAAWMRNLIRPEAGRALLHFDWSQQEFGIAAALSGDPAMIAAYQSGDPYLEFARQARAIPPGGTKATHRSVREHFKSCCLAVQYGMEACGLGLRIQRPESYARELLGLHHETYRQFWEWSQSAVDFGMLGGTLKTVLGWPLHIGSEVNPRMLRNFPMQANGAEMLRLASIFATESGSWLCAPIHDALLVESSDDEVDEVAAAVGAAMDMASVTILDGFQLRRDMTVIRYPDRFGDERGTRMWETAWRIVEELNQPNI